MKRAHSLLGLVTLLGSLLLAGAVLAAPAASKIQRWVIGAGGGHSQAGIYALDGAIGQPLVGRSASAGYELSSGFWVGVSSPGGEERIYLPLVLRNR